MLNSNMALMDAGVPIKAPVAGIAMGLIKEGDDIDVKLMEIDPKTGKFKLSHRVLIEKPKDYVERPARQPRERRGERRQHNENRENNHENKENKEAKGEVKSSFDDIIGKY